MIEGQNGVDWEIWTRVGRTVEDLGFAGLSRSDQFPNPDGPVTATREPWITLTLLADHPNDPTFGPFDTPGSVRPPCLYRG